MEAMIMKEKAIRICLAMALYFLIGLFYLASFIGCTDTKIVTASKIADSDGKVTLSWNNVPGAISYNIYFSRSPKVTQWNSYKIPAAWNTIEVIELELSKTYYFAITVVDQSGESSILMEKSYTVADKAGVLDFGDLAEKRQNVEGQISKVQLTEGQATILWDNVPNGISYNIYYGESPGVTKQNGIKIANVTSPYKVKGLKPEKVYYFVVTSVTNSGESMESPELSIKAEK
jgi:hypothetical protein